LKAMGEYLSILRGRAKLEGIDLWLKVNITKTIELVK
jgi:hypothetical protein